MFASPFELVCNEIVCPPELMSLRNPDCPLVMLVKVRVRLPAGVLMKFYPPFIS